MHNWTHRIPLLRCPPHLGEELGNIEVVQDGIENA